VIAPAEPGMSIWSGKQRLDLRACEEVHLGPRKRLLGIARTRWICAAWAGSSMRHIEK